MTHIIYYTKDIFCTTIMDNICQRLKHMTRDIIEDVTYLTGKHEHSLRHSKLDESSFKI